MNMTEINLSEAHKQGFYEIGQVAELSGLSAKMIRYYESIGVIAQAKRTQANYRIYDEQDVETLIFIKRARAFDFRVPQIKQLLELQQNPHRTSSEVKQLFLSHIKKLDKMIDDMQKLRGTLQQVAAHCQGNEDSECPILETLTYKESRVNQN